MTLRAPGLTETHGSVASNERGRDLRRSPLISEGKSKNQITHTQKRERKVMPNVGDKSPDDKWVELHSASLDALVRGSPAPRTYQPYPGDHPCAVCRAPYAPFGVGKPLRFWFCRAHMLLEEPCPTPPQPTQSKSLTPSVGLAATYGEKGLSPKEPTQLTFFNNGPSTTGS